MTRLTVTQAAQRMNRTPSGVRLLIRQGKLQAEKMDTPRGPIYYLDPADVDAFQPQQRGRPKKEKEENR